jgi:hypothetical protein
MDPADLPGSSQLVSVLFTIVDDAFEGANSFYLTVTEFNVSSFYMDRSFGSL